MNNQNSTSIIGVTILIAIGMIIWLVGSNIVAGINKTYSDLANALYINYSPAVVEKEVEFDPCELNNVECDVEEPTREDLIKERITKVAAEYQWPAEQLIDLAICETTDLDPATIGGLADCFLGLYQWNKCAGGLITEDCAYDVECSTATTIRALQRGEGYWRWPDCL